MRVHITMENSACSENFACEHGLGLYIETGDTHILFDTGASPAFADNAKVMGLDLSRVDFAVLSHGHYDHSGGIQRFLLENDHAPLYINEKAFGAYVSRKVKNISISADLQSNPRLIRTGDFQKLAENMTLLTCNGEDLKYPIEHHNLYALTGGQLLPDTFRHEHYLVVEEAGKRIVISGCSHKGICNIVHWLKPDVLIGGFHFSKIETEGEGRAKLLAAAEELASCNTVYYTGHCTGDAQYDVMKEVMGDRLHRIRAGQTYDI